jgi:hypothetical protein
MVSRIQLSEHGHFPRKGTDADSSLTHENPASVFAVITAADDDKPAGTVVSWTACRAARQLNFVCGRCWRTPSR